MKWKRLLLAVLAALLVLAAAGYWFVMQTRAGQDMALEFATGALTAPAAAPPADTLRVVMCGTASPLGAVGRRACVAVLVGKRFYLVDAGAGSGQTLTLKRIPAQRLEAVFITHYHSDHIDGLPNHNQRSWVAGRPAPLQVVGPPGIEEVVAGFNRAYAQDRQHRIDHHGEDLLPPALGVMQPRVIEPGVVHDADGLRITAFAVDHSPVAPAFGYRFDYKGRSVVVSGDTVVTPSLESMAAGVDLLIHDALSEPLVSAMAARANPRMQKVMVDVLDYHAHTTDVAALAERAGVRKLAFYHLVPVPQNALMTAIFMRDIPDSVVLTEDGMTFDLPADSEEILVDGQRG